MRRHRNLNPYPDLVSDRVWHLLFTWAEWRSVRSCPRSPRPPEATFRWTVAKGVAIGEPGYCLASSTAPRDPGIMEIFNQAMMDLAEDQRAYLAAVVERQTEPWLRGKSWRQWFMHLGVTRRDYERLLRHALRSLMISVAKRGLT